MRSLFFDSNFSKSVEKYGFAKYLNQTEKMPDCLIPFLEDIKRDMEIMRLKNIKDLRTICQNLYEFKNESLKALIYFP